MLSAIVTTRGRVTIPLALRKAMRLKPSAQVEFTRNADGSYTLTERTVSAGASKKSGMKPLG
jgi:bifunctional DNA-binding transcriptional regulator/antitoxin component of YhaV-PrlF toxin-antitoxin module